MRINTVYPSKPTNLSNSLETTSSSAVDNIKKRIIKNIQAYIKHKITLEELVKRIGEIKAENYSILNQETKKIIDELLSLSVIDDILSDVLDELLNK